MSDGARHLANTVDQLFFQICGNKFVRERDAADVARFDVHQKTLWWFDTWGPEYFWHENSIM